MKKLFAMAAFAAAMILGACTGSQTSEEALDLEKSTPEAVVSSLTETVKAGDATAITAALTSVQTQLGKLLEEGNAEKVAEYAAKIQTFVEENAEALKGLNIDVTPLTTVIEQVKALPGNAQEAAQDAAATVQSEVEGAVEGAVQDAQATANEAVEAGKAAANEAVEAGKAAANEAVEAGKAAVEEGKAKANEAIQKGADQLKF